MKRCKTGLRLLKQWAAQVQAATMDTYSRIMFGKRPYDAHVAKCEKCKQAGIKAPIGDKR